MSRQRYLEPSEAYHAFVNWSGSYSVAYEGRIDAQLLTEAFDSLCESNSLLRARLCREKDGFVFFVPTGRGAEVTVRDGGEPVYLEEMGRPLDSTSALCRLVLVRGAEQGGHLILVLHHSMIDGRGGITLLEQLLRRYTALTRGEATPVPADPPLPSPAEELLRTRGGPGAPDGSPGSGRVDRAALRAALSGTPSPAPLEVAADRLRLDVRTTAELTGRLRAERLSVHAYLCGAATVALRDTLEPGDGPRPMVCGCPVDLRERVRPPVTVAESTNFVSGVEAGVSVPRGGDPRAVGRRIKARLDAAVADGEAERAILEAQQFTAAEPTAVDLVVTNLGPIPEFTAPRGVRVTDFRGFTTTTMTGLLLFVVTSYGGRLSVEITSPVGHLDGAARAALVRRMSDLLGAPAPAPARARA